MSEAASVLDFGAMPTPELGVPEPEETPTPAPEESVPPEPEGGEPTPEPEGGQPEGGKPGPPSLKAIRDAVNAFSETNPELGKQLKALLGNEGRFRAYQEIYPDLDAARSMKAAIESAGGLDGLTKLSELQDYVDGVNEKWDAGDPTALDAVENPLPMLPHFLNKSEKANSQAFGEALRPHLVRQLQGANFENVLSALAGVVKDNPQAKEIVDSMVAWFSDQKRGAEKTNLDALEPERKKLGDRESKVAERENKQFEGEVGSKVSPHMNKLFGEGMRSYLANATHLSEAQKQDIARAWMAELGKAFGKEHHDRVASMMKSRNRNADSVGRYATDRMSAVAKQVTDEIVKRYKLTPGKPGAKPAAKPGEQPPPTGQGSSPSSPIRVKDRPADSNIDWDADPDRIHFFAGKAKLLTGSKQWVKWR